MNSHPNPHYKHPLPPAILLTPSTSGLAASERLRSRSGTLPLFFPQNNTLSSSNLPSLEAHILQHIEQFLVGVSPPASAHAIDIPAQQAPQNTRRMRLGLLFLTNSIWNDDALLPQQQGGLLDSNSMHLFESGLAGASFLSPLLSAQGSSQNAAGASQTTRNRSYTTTAANPLPMGYTGMDVSAASRLSGSSFVPTASKQEMGFLLDPSPPAAPGPARNRSQTYSGATPVIPEAFIHGPNVAAQNHLNFTQQNLHQAPPAPPPAQNYGSYAPRLLDDFDFGPLSITTTFENPSMSPTRSILIDNLPVFIDAGKLHAVLNNSLGAHRATGSVESVRISPSLLAKLALVECNSIDIAMALKANFNHLELVPGVILYVAFATVTENATRPPQGPENAGIPHVLLVLLTSQNGSVVSSATGGSNSSTYNDKLKPTPTDVLSIRESLVRSITCLSSTSQFVDLNKVISIINKSIRYPNENYQDNFGPLPDPIPLRQFDLPKLRELRKILENNEALQAAGVPLSSVSTASDDDTKAMSQIELEELCLAMLDELPELCYDYLGNTIVQKIFLVVESPLIKLMMVKEITPFLTQLSIHKNGTWAIQKIISLCHTDYQQKYLIAASLKPYAVKLFNDQFGNYVLQGCIKFGSPFNDFIFETMLDNFVEISFGRFGARCIRTILESANESNAVSTEQIILVAGLIVEFSNELVVNNNGLLLITWFLDTFSGLGATVDDRFELLTRKFVPNLLRLATHKLANLTLLKILNNRLDLNLKQLIMDRIFGDFDDSDDDPAAIRPPSKMLEAILADSPENSAGPVFIYKIVSNPLLLTLAEDNDASRSARYQHFVVQQVRLILLEANIANFQPYKKLMDEVGLSSTRLNRLISVSNRRGKKPGPGARVSTKGHQAPVHHQQQQEALTMAYMNGNNPQGGQKMGYGISQQYNGHPQQANYAPMGTQNGYVQQPHRPQVPQEYYQQQQQYQQYQQPSSQHELAVMQQLEQLSLSSAALGYNSNPGTPNANVRSLFF